MRIVTLNTWGGRVYEPLRAWLRDIDADIYCLQEVFSSQEYGFYSDEVPEGRQGDPLIRVNLFEEVQKILPDHRGMMLPQCRWQVHNTFKKEEPLCQLGIATFVRKGILMGKGQSGFVYQEYREIPQTELPTPRVAHAVRIIPAAGRPVVVAHMHGLWIREGKHDTLERVKQAELFLSLIESVCEVGDSVVACGDFNVLPNSATLPILQGLHDLVVRGGHTSTRTPLYYNSRGKKDLPRFADYMLVSPGVKVEKFDVVHEPIISDHCPLVLDIE
jgi:endonuclease/exonuclease/phosphatase family metal-dependent hydrolase